MPRKYITAIIVIVAISIFSVGPTWAEDHPKNNPRPSFSKLVLKLKKTTNRIRTVLVPSQSRSYTFKPVTAVFKLESTEASSAQKPAALSTQKPTEMPHGAISLSVSASGAFAAVVPGAGRATFKKNQEAKVAFRDGTYYLIQDRQVTATSKSPIKFSPSGPDSFLSLPGYTDLNWNQTVNLNSFRGSIEIVRSEKSKTLWAVNELGLEDYLRGIAEASHDSPVEHLKVMAIVSRSYAVHHLSKGGRHAGEPFHMKNSQNGNGDDQVYRGYSAEQRLPRIAKAAADTKGTVVTYQGNPVITPYSTRASGRTRTPAEAGWNYDWPWVKSVPDPDTQGMTRLGHGVGLSGYGSKKRAERGDSAAVILGYYFPGSSLGQVDTSSQIIRVSIYGQPAK